MVIQHNIAAINSYRNYSGNQSKVNSNLEKLSSGYRINRASDDAAGMAISEQMRSKINGLDQAVSNAKDAMGLIQTAEGALTETHSMLQRMVTLATQAANGTYATQGTTDARSSIQKEMNELAMEMERIARTTDYNGVKPLYIGGTSSSMTMQVGPSAAETLTIGKYNMSYGALIQQYQNANGDFASGRTVGESSASITYTTTAPTLRVLDQTNVSYLTGTDISMTFDNAAGSTYITVKIQALDMSTVSKANASIKAINSAINRVSIYRAELGAKQNRLEHTISNLQVTSENITAAESRIRDTDMAKEIANYTKNNILNQAAQSMLAQANQQPQSVLSLLS